MRKIIHNELNVKEYSVISNTKYCLKATIEHYPLLLLWYAIAVIINVLLPIFTMYLPKAVIDDITFGSGARKLIITILSYSICIALLSGAKQFMEKFTSFHKYKMNTYYTRKVAHKGMTTDYCNQEKEHFRKLQSESFNSCNGHYSPMTQIYDICNTLFTNIIGFTIYFGILSKLNIVPLLFIAANTIVSYFLNKRVINWAAENNKEKIGYGQKTNYINKVSADIKSAKDIRLYNMQSWLEGVYQINMKGLSGWYARYTKKVFQNAVADGGLSLFREGAAYAYLLYSVFTSRIGVSDFVLYFGAIVGFSGWLSGILGQINSLNRVNLTVNYLRAFLEFPESYKRQGGVETVGIMVLPKVIELKNVSYRYEGASEDTLKNINLIINPAEHLAVVGLNGAGKTTLVKLICGLCDPTEGEVLYDGTDVREYNRSAYYKLFTAVFQQYSILPVTIEEIVAESVTEKVDTKRVKECLRAAGLSEKIAALSHGLKSNYSKTIYNDGAEFSGGEIQKLLMARALYKNAPVMILDEPTAALDPISESRLYETYSDLMIEKSTIFISHRLASTHFCHRIILIEHGSICEEGTHESLLMQKGRYFSLFETQSKYYRDNPTCEEGHNDQ